MIEKVIEFGNQFHDCVTVTEISGLRRVIYTNAKFSKTTGIDRKEMIGKSLSVLQGPLTHKGVVLQMREALNNMQACCQDLINYRANGEAFLNRLVLIPIEHGDRPFFLGFQNDITDKKINSDAGLFKSAANGEIRHILNSKLAALFLTSLESGDKEMIGRLVTQVNDFATNLYHMENFENFSLKATAGA
ncbi:MAG: PAS domain-containing protein [Bdellovibrionales bacterium]|nr:PAS domain-containing protein [Bdellovibrionales bacterium]